MTKKGHRKKYHRSNYFEQQNRDIGITSVTFYIKKYISDFFLPKSYQGLLKVKNEKKIDLKKITVANAKRAKKLRDLCTMHSISLDVSVMPRGCQ